MDLHCPPFTRKLLELAVSVADRHARSWQDHSALLSAISIIGRIASTTLDEAVRSGALRSLVHCLLIITGPNGWIDQIELLLTKSYQFTIEETNKIRLHLIEACCTAILIFFQDSREMQALLNLLEKGVQEFTNHLSENYTNLVFIKHQFLFFLVDGIELWLRLLVKLIDNILLTPEALDALSTYTIHLLRVVLITANNMKPHLLKRLSENKSPLSNFVKAYWAEAKRGTPIKWETVAIAPHVFMGMHELVFPILQSYLYHICEQQLIRIAYTILLYMYLLV